MGKHRKRNIKIKEEITDLLHGINLNFMIESYHPNKFTTIERLSKKYCQILADRIVKRLKNITKD